MYTEANINFINGRWEITKGKKYVAIAYDREVMFEGTKFEGHFSYPYALEIRGLGMIECKTKGEILKWLNKYL